MPLREYNVFNSVVTAEATSRCEAVVKALIDKKNAEFSRMTPKQQSQKLKQNPEFLYSLGYEEPVSLDSVRKTTARYYFRSIAADYKLTTRINGFDATNDMALVDHLSYLSAETFHGKPLKSKKTPAYAILGTGRNVEFLQFTRAIVMRKGTPTEQELVSGVVPQSAHGMTDHVAALIAAGEGNADTLQVEIAKLRAENAALAAQSSVSATPSGPPTETPTSPSTATVQ